MSELNVNFRNSMHEVEIATKSSCPIVWVRTHEEARFIENFKNVADKKLKRDMYVWSAWQGIVPVSALTA